MDDAPLTPESPATEPQEGANTPDGLVSAAPVTPVAPIDAATAAPPASGIRVVFFGPNGLRAAWRLGIFLVIAALVALSLGGLAHLLLSHHLPRRADAFTPGGVLYGEGVVLLAVLAATAIMGLIEKRSLGEYGLPLRSALGGWFWWGVLWGWAALTLLLLTLHWAGAFTFGSLAIHGHSAAQYAGLWALAFLAVGGLEESLMRGYALHALTTGMGFWPAAILLSLIFGSVHLHNPGEDWVGGLAAGLIGLFFAFTLRRTGVLWFAIGFHAAWDYSESFLYSVPDSGMMAKGHLLNSSFHGPAWLTGGSVGPEGSYPALALIGILFVLFAVLYPEARFPSGVSKKSPVA